MPYLTPEDVPESTTCRALLIPESSDWLAIYSGALTELTKRWNWEQQGISIDDALASVNAVIAGFYDGCVSSGCEQPGGYALLRVGESGRVEQLIGGEWVEPEGENAFPPVPARTEPTPEDRRCLAAANAASALQELYERVSEVAQYGLGVAELINLLVAGMVARFFWIAPIINGTLLIATGILELLIKGAQYVSADVWDTSFDDVIRCFLYECSSDDGDVVTFDYDCLMNSLYELNVTPPFNEARARLASQLATLIPVVGGVDSLNQLGATTEVETADCDDCGEWCITFDFAESDWGWVADENAGDTYGQWVVGQGWMPLPGVTGYSERVVSIHLPFDITNALRFQIDYYNLNPLDVTSQCYNTFRPVYPDMGDTSCFGSITTPQEHDFGGLSPIDTFGIMMDRGGAFPLEAGIARFTLWGSGTRPELGEPC